MLALVKGIREPHVEKKKNILTLVGIKPTTSELDLPLLCSVTEVVGSIPTEVKRFFLYLVWFPDSLY